ncbi:MAG: barstar family protein [Candidatus Solibacter usitatus]|nr:barstar family protein [Candidatus Solibacter usitatus]
MSLTLEQIVTRLEDPETPVVWLDPSAPPDIWLGLPGALRQRGYWVLDLDRDKPILDVEALLDRFAEVAPLPEYFRHNLSSLRDSLLGLPNDADKGWVVIFRHPEALRQNDEAAFEDFLEILEFIHESKYEIHRRVFKLVVRD